MSNFSFHFISWLIQISCLIVIKSVFKQVILSPHFHVRHIRWIWPFFTLINLFIEKLCIFTENLQIYIRKFTYTDLMMIARSPLMIFQMILAHNALLFSVYKQMYTQNSPPCSFTSFLLYWFLPESRGEGVIGYVLCY